MPGHTCDHTCACQYACRIPCTKEKSPVPASFSTVQLHMPNRTFVVTTEPLVAITVRFQNSALSCFILNKTFDISDTKILDSVCNSKYLRPVSIQLHFSLVWKKLTSFPPTHAQYGENTTESEISVLLRCSQTFRGSSFR